jgi:hypothetical protein
MVRAYVRGYHDHGMLTTAKHFPGRGDVEAMPGKPGWSWINKPAADVEAQEFRSELGVTQSGLDRIIRISYELLGLISFFTTASDEVRAWTVRRNSTAQKAAGKIHTDMERGFIRAEVISHDELVKCSSLAEARKHGVLRLEGKNYIVQDGDVITILFNV